MGAAKTDDDSHGDFFPGVCPVQRNPVYFPARDTRRKGIRPPESPGDRMSAIGQKRTVALDVRRGA